MENQLCQFRDSCVYECIPKCVLGFSFDFCSLFIAVVSLWGEKVDLPKIGYDVLTWIILVFEDRWEAFCTFFRCRKEQQWPEVSGSCAVVQPEELNELSRESAHSGPAAFASGPHFNLINTFPYWWSCCFGTLSFRQSMYLLPNYRV